VTQTKSVSEGTARKIDEEIRSFIDRNYERAEKILKDNLDILHSMADALIEWETIDRLQIDDLMNCKKARSPADYDDKDADKNAKSGTTDSNLSDKISVKPVVGPAA